MGGSWGTAHEVLHTDRSIRLDLGCGAADPKGQQQTRPADADDAALNGDRKWIRLRSLWPFRADVHHRQVADRMCWSTGTAT